MTYQGPPPLLAIDCPSNRVRRYTPKRAGGRLTMTDECKIVRPQCDTLAEQLESLRSGRPMEFAALPDAPEAA